MVEQKAKPRADELEPAAEKPKPGGRWVSWGSPIKLRWIVALVVASILVHGFGFSYYRLMSDRVDESSSPEFSLGTFRFQDDRTDTGRYQGAEFSLHLTLLEPASGEAKRRLEMHPQRVKQDIEQLLRGARSEDFEDPNLVGLKRQIQQQVNTSLDMRAVADVLVTDLRLHRAEKEASPAVVGTSSAAARPSS